jgi:hypothetical protein
MSTSCIDGSDYIILVETAHYMEISLQTCTEIYYYNTVTITQCVYQFK